MLNQYWIHFTHNGEKSQTRQQAENDEQAIYNGLSFAGRCYPDELIALLHAERLTTA